MGQVFKQNNGKWGIRYELPGSSRTNRKRKQVGGFSTKGAARTALTSIEEKVNSNTYIENNLSVIQMFELLFKDYINHQAPKTIEYYEQLYTPIVLKYFEDVQLSKLNADHIRSFLNTLKKVGYSDDRQKKVYKFFKLCLNKAYEWELTSKRVMDHIKAPKVVREPADYWTEEQIREALTYFKGTKMYYYVYMAVNLGLRQGEICAIKESDISFKKKTLSITKTLQYIEKKKELVIKDPKSKKSIRVLPLDDDIIILLKSRIKNIKENQLALGPKYNTEYQGFLSVNTDGSILTDRYVSKTYAKLIRRQSSIPVIKFHELRHSCASWLIANGTDLRTVQEILGHSSIQITADIYSHMEINQKRTALSRKSF